MPHNDYRDDEELKPEELELLEEQERREMLDSQQHAEERAKILNELGMTLSKTRSEAINGREQSGIENEWLEDEEHYEGVDDANRGEMSAWRGKPLGQAGLPSTDDTSSTVFFNITGPYVDAAAAKFGDMLLPTDERGWSIGPTPIADLVAIGGGKIPPQIEQKIQQGHAGDPEAADKTRQDLVEQTKQELDVARAKADKAQERIDDWHTESQYQAENRLVIEDSAKLGTGVLKGPIPERRRQVAFMDGALIIQEELKPVSRRVDPWNCFPDPACGESIHNGSYFWERDDITSKALQDLKGMNYLDDQIDEALREGAHKAFREFKEGDGRADRLGLIERTTKNLYEIWYFYGLIDKEDMEAAGCECDEDQESVFALLTMVNNRVIKAAMNPLDTGEFPYDFMTWKRRAGSPFGTGVARQVRTPQRIVNGAARNLMDNSGLAAGPMWVFLQGLIEPLDGVYEIAPRKGWMAAEDAELDDIRKAFHFVEMPMMQAELQAILMLGLKMAEDVTGLPMLLQGQQGSAPDTVGGMQILNNNGSAVMRRIVRLYDDLVTEPHVRRYYTYLLQFGEDEEKGDFVIEARGSAALIERDIQNQQIKEMAEIVRDPVFGLDPKKWVKEYLKSQRFDPKQFEYDDEKWQQIVEQLSQPPEQAENPAMAIAELRAGLEKWKTASAYELAMLKLQKDDQHRQADREVDIAFKMVEKEIEAMKLEGNKDVSLDKIKAMLAGTVMKLNTQKELSLGKVQTTPEVASPAVEPIGHAPDGEAFQK